MSWKRIGMKCSAMMERGEVGSRWWMSATLPAIEFSTGIMASSASPLAAAWNTSSKVAQGIGSSSGWVSRQAMWELAPSSPWKAIFFIAPLCIGARAMGTAATWEKTAAGQAETRPEP